MTVTVLQEQALSLDIQKKETSEGTVVLVVECIRATIRQMTYVKYLKVTII